MLNQHLPENFTIKILDKPCKLSPGTNLCSSTKQCDLIRKKYQQSQNNAAQRTEFSSVYRLEIAQWQSDCLGYIRSWVQLPASLSHTYKDPRVAISHNTTRSNFHNSVLTCKIYIIENSCADMKVNKIYKVTMGWWECNWAP